MPPAGGRGAVAGPTQDGHRAGAGRSRGGCKMVTWPLWDGYGAVMGRLWDGYGAPMHPDMRPRRARTKKERRRFGKPGNRLYFCVGGMAEWSIAAVLKTVELQGSGGSNPSSSADAATAGDGNPVAFFIRPPSAHANRRFPRRTSHFFRQKCSTLYNNRYLCSGEQYQFI